MSEKIVQLNEDVLRDQLKVLCHPKKRKTLKELPAPPTGLL